MNGDPATLFVKGTAVKVALDSCASICSIDWTSVSGDRLVNVIGALGCVDMDGGTFEGIGALLHEPSGHV